MVRIRCNRGWSRRGISLLWDPHVLAELTAPGDVVSLRGLFAVAAAWPDDLPAAGGNTLVVAGLEGCLDVLDGEDAACWMETDLRDAVLSFQDHYQGGAGLVFWLPSGHSRLTMKAATERYFWRHRASGAEGLPIGQLLFSGAESEVERILDTEEGPGTDYDGKHWVGLHHPRIS